MFAVGVSTAVLIITLHVTDCCYFVTAKTVFFEVTPRVVVVRAGAVALTTTVKALEFVAVLALVTINIVAELVALLSLSNCGV